MPGRSRPRGPHRAQRRLRCVNRRPIFPRRNTAYSKLKAFLRKIAERTVAGLLIALDACADIFKPAECVNYCKACGYDTG
jgi:hypothetical protein